MSLRFSRERWPRKFLIPNLPHRVERGTIQIIKHRQEAAAPQYGTSLKHRRTQMERTPSRGPKRARRNAVQRTRSPHASRMQETNPRRWYSRSVRRYHLGMGKCPDLPKRDNNCHPKQGTRIAMEQPPGGDAKHTSAGDDQRSETATEKKKCHFMTCGAMLPARRQAPRNSTSSRVTSTANGRTSVWGGGP